MARASPADVGFDQFILRGVLKGGLISGVSSVGWAWFRRRLPCRKESDRPSNNGVKKRCNAQIAAIVENDFPEWRDGARRVVQRFPRSRDDRQRVHSAGAGRCDRRIELRVKRRAQCFSRKSLNGGQAFGESLQPFGVKERSRERDGDAQIA